jgi:Zn-dependent M28 family amino/carboxypeptidase
MSKILFVLLFIFFSIQNKPVYAEPISEEFSGNNAYLHLKKQLIFGPRYVGSAGHRQVQRYIIEQLKKYGWNPEQMIFSQDTPIGKKVFTNIIATKNKLSNKIVLICSHYDTKWFRNINFVGANDAGSSTAVLLELARVLGLPKYNNKFSYEPILVFFDGEEAFIYWSDTDSLYGSRYFVSQWKKQNKLEHIKCMVLIDMVGDKNWTITVPENSDKKLIELLLLSAEKLGIRNKITTPYRFSIEDDHIPFVNEGIPAIDIIDFEYGSAPGKNDYWHTIEDNLDKISIKSLTLTGKLVLEFLSNLDK